MADRHGRPATAHPARRRPRRLPRRDRRRPVPVARRRRLVRGRRLGGRPQPTNPRGARSPAHLEPLARAPSRVDRSADGAVGDRPRRPAVRRGAPRRRRPVRPDGALGDRPDRAAAGAARSGRARRRRRGRPRLVPSVAPTGRSSPTACPRVAARTACCTSCGPPPARRSARRSPTPVPHRSPGGPTVRASGTPAIRPATSTTATSASTASAPTRPHDDVVLDDFPTAESWPEVTASDDGRHLLVHTMVGWITDRRHVARRRDRGVARCRPWRRGPVGVRLPRSTTSSARRLAMRRTVGSSPRRSTIRRRGGRSSPSARSCSVAWSAAGAMFSSSPRPTASTRSRRGRWRGPAALRWPTRDSSRCSRSTRTARPARRSSRWRRSTPRRRCSGWTTTVCAGGARRHRRATSCPTWSSSTSPTRRSTARRSACSSCVAPT